LSFSQGDVPRDIRRRLLAVDWLFEKKFDAYAGFMFSQVNGGLASGYLHRNTIDPTVGLSNRF
jgi:hypothetical protein